MTTSPVPARQQVRRLPYIAAVEQRLAGLSNVTGYVEQPHDVPRIGADGHVARHWILHPWFGTPTLEQDLAQGRTDIDWTFQVTCVAAWKRDCMALAEAVDALLHLWTPVAAGHSAGELRPPFGYEAGPPMSEGDVKPIRWSLALQYRTPLARLA